MSLLDYPGKVASILFTQGCWFRCAYCHNPELIPAAREAGIATSDVFAYLEQHRGMLDGVTVTGGEPTIHEDLFEFLARIKEMGFSVKLDTNGVRPTVVRQLVSDGLVDYIAMDLKHTWEKYLDVVKITNASLVDACRETFEFIQACGIPHEFRTTIFPGVHTNDDFFVMASYLKPGDAYYIQDTQFVKVLDPSISRVKDIRPAALEAELRERYPGIIFGVR